MNDARANPSAATLRSRFGAAIAGSHVSCGDTIVVVAQGHAHEVLRWLKETPTEAYEYLVDVTAVEYRDRERPLEVVYQLWSLSRKVFLRVKVELPKGDPLAVDSIVDLWRGADWLEREVFDLFGITFRGHPDLRRILMWDGYLEGHPLRKDFPLRGRFSRAEQVRQALTKTPEAHHSAEELAVAAAFQRVSDDARQRSERAGPGRGA